MDRPFGDQPTKVVGFWQMFGTQELLLDSDGDVEGIFLSLTE